MVADAEAIAAATAEEKGNYAGNSVHIMEALMEHFERAEASALVVNPPSQEADEAEKKKKKKKKKKGVTTGGRTRAELR